MSATSGRLRHHYGPQVHLLDDVWSRSLLAQLCAPSTKAPAVHALLEACYRQLLAAAAEQLPVEAARLPTRMTAQHPEALLAVSRVVPTSPVVLVDIARGGIIPSYVLQRELLTLLDPDVVRVDHLYYQRVTDEAGHVVGVSASGSKIGGSVAGATLMVPDPMAATGGSLCRALETYAARTDGSPARVIALHLIVTPEHLKRVTSAFPHVHIYALRVDRGLSSPEVLASEPGARWSEERGLDAHDYIVPGAGGLGELLNNSWV